MQAEGVPFHRLIKALRDVCHIFFATFRLHTTPSGFTIPLYGTGHYIGVEGEMDQVMCWYNRERGRADHVVSGVVKLARKELQ